MYVVHILESFSSFCSYLWKDWLNRLTSLPLNFPFKDRSASNKQQSKKQTIIKQQMTHTYQKKRSTVEPRPTDTRLILTPVYYGQFRLSRWKANIFLLKLTRLIQTPVTTDNGHFSALPTLVICTQTTFIVTIMCFQIVDQLYPVQIMTNFYGLIRFYKGKYREM